MRNHARLPKAGHLPKGPQPVFQLLVAYEDFDSGQRAIDTCHFLQAQLAPDFEFQSSMWKFDMLRIPKLSQMAAEDAAAADMIIVAAHDEGELPDELKTWVETWLPMKRNQTRALVALLDGSFKPSGATSPVYAYLKQVAQRAHMDFFARAIGPPGSEHGDGLGKHGRTLCERRGHPG